MPSSDLLGVRVATGQKVGGRAVSGHGDGLLRGRNPGCRAKSKRYSPYGLMWRDAVGETWASCSSVISQASRRSCSTTSAMYTVFQHVTAAVTKLRALAWSAWASGSARRIWPNWPMKIHRRRAWKDSPLLSGRLISLR